MREGLSLATVTGECLLPGLCAFREAAEGQQLVIVSNSFLLLPKRMPSLLNHHNLIFPKRLHF